MTAVAQSTSPDPRDSLFYAVLFAADQISAIRTALFPPKPNLRIVIPAPTERPER